MSNVENERGRRAGKPGQLGKSGWRDILIRVKNKLGQKNINIIAAGVAFFAFLALFPAIAALISIYGLIISPEQVQQQLTVLAEFLPPQARELIQAQLSTIVSQSAGALSWGLVFSILLGLWSANAGTKALFRGLNVAFDQPNQRGFIKENAISLPFTLFLIIIVIISMAMIVAFPIIIGALGLPVRISTLLGSARWLLLIILLFFTLSTIYKFGPSRKQARWEWVNWGAFIATVLWILGSWLFSLYVANFASYNETYGSVAAVVILLFWFLLTSFVILLGGIINAEMEYQTAEDTTGGPGKNMGDRGANPADNLGETP
ncbi:MAG: YihY/virulence factor BrkB family protein [Chitinispirillaceae bacterium]